MLGRNIKSSVIIESRIQLRFLCHWLSIHTLLNNEIMNWSLKSFRSHFAVLVVEAKMSISVYKLGSCIIWKTTLFFILSILRWGFQHYLSHIFSLCWDSNSKSSSKEWVGDEINLSTSPQSSKKHLGACLCQRAQPQEDQRESPVSQKQPMMQKYRDLAIHSSSGMTLSPQTPASNLPSKK